MKKLFLIFVGLICFSFLVNAQTSTSQTKPSTSSSSSGKPKNTFEKPLAQPGAVLPSFTFLTSDEKLYADSNLRKNAPLILVLFNPQCGHCMEVAVSMKQRIQELEHADIVFLTGNNLLGELPFFIQQTRFSGMPNVYVAIDHSDVTKSLFEYNGIPQIMVYNTQHVLLKTYYKEVNMDELVQLIRR